MIVTLEVGPRIIRYAFHDERNVFVEMPEELGRAGENEWMMRGGHRFWTAPEADHSYELDNSPVTWKVRAGPREGKFDLRVKSSTGAAQRQPVQIKERGIFGR